VRALDAAQVPAVGVEPQTESAVDEISGVLGFGTMVPGRPNLL